MDDNIRFLKELTENNYNSIFEHPYLAMYNRLHEEFGLKVQLNLFYRMEGFDLSRMSSAYQSEWEENAEWLKFSFHSDVENVKPYEVSGYEEVYHDCKKVNDEIVRFASSHTLAKTTTVHYCLATKDGLKALADNNVIGLLGLFEENQTSYGICEDEAKKLRAGKIVKLNTISYGAIDIVLNKFSKEDNLIKLQNLMNHNNIKVMIHEQYFYADYGRYQPDFEEKLREVFEFLSKQGYESKFFEELI